jgi:alpha-glucoside transport system permease protein
VDVEARPKLWLEVAGREFAGCRRGEPPAELQLAPEPEPEPEPRHRGPYLLGVPALLLVVLLLVPMVWTVVWALRADLPLIGNFRDILTDPGALEAGLHSLLWVLIALALIAVGYGIAVLSVLVREFWRVLLYLLILPFGVSALVSGAVFRMIFDPNPERGMASALFGDGLTWLGPDLIWLVLASAFAWTWLGFIVVLFRAGLLTDRARRRPGPVTTIVVLTVLVAAIRVFDLVLIVAPSSGQDKVDVVGLHWWRMVSGSGDTGGPAALAVLLFVIVAALALAGMRGARGTAAPVARAGPEPETPAPHRFWSRLIGVALGLFWVLPVVILLATALHEPAAAGSGGWWRLDGLGLGSFAALADSWLWPALLSNVVLAGFATALVVAAAAPAAYLLVWGGLPRWLSGGLTTLLVVLAVAPVQLYAAPLDDAIAALGLTGSFVPIALIHAAAGVPFATLVLRTAFLAAQVHPGEQRPALDVGWRWRRFRPAVIAVVVLEFVLVWNDFIVGFLIGGQGLTPFTLVLWGEARQFGTSAGTVAAGSVAAAVVPVVVLLTTWPRVVAGLTGSRV